MNIYILYLYILYFFNNKILVFLNYKLAIFHNMGLKEIVCIKVAPSNNYTGLQFYFFTNLLIYINIYVYFMYLYFIFLIKYI